MSLLSHLIYELKKGLRGLALITIPSLEIDASIEKIDRFEFEYYVQIVSETKVNIFFGTKPCVDIVRRFGEKKLSDYSAEEDFILGIMLGYDRGEQCNRYLGIKKNETIKHKTTINDLTSRIFLN